MKSIVEALSFEGYETDPIWIYHFMGKTWGTSVLSLFSGDVADLILHNLGLGEEAYVEWVERHGSEPVRYETTSHEKLKPEHRELTFVSSMASMFAGTRHAQIRALHRM